MTRQKQRIFVVLNTFLLITAVIILAVYSKQYYFCTKLWLTEDNAFDFSNDYLKIVIFTSVIGSSIFTYFITFTNLKKLSISKRISICLKIDSWMSVAFVLIFCQDDFHLGLYLYFILKTIILRILVSELYYIKNGKEKDSDVNESI